MTDSSSLVRYLIGASRVKFEVLESLYSGIDSSKYRMGVMYVDAHSIFYRLFREKDLASTYSDGYQPLVRDLVVGFFNVIGHYRRFMATRLHLDNDIYVLFCPYLPKYQAKLYPDYCKDKYKKYSIDHPDYGFHAKAVRDAYDFIVGLSPYFEGIYCIKCPGIDEFSMIGRMGFADDILYTIFSRNVYCVQYLQDNVVQFYNRRDKSHLITKSTCYSDGILMERKTEASEKLTPDMAPLLWTLGGCKDICMDPCNSVSGITQMVRIANKMVDAGDLVSGMSLQSFLDILPKYLKSKVSIASEKAELERRYKVLNGMIAGAAMTSDQIAKVKAQCYDVYNENELEQLNELLALGEVDPDLLEIGNLNMSEAPRYE